MCLFRFTSGRFTSGMIFGGLCLFGMAVQAQTVVPVQTLPAGTIITADLLREEDTQNQMGMAQTIAELVGKQTKTALYINRPIYLAHVGEPEVIERNDIVTIVFDNGALRITGEGRALDPGQQNQRIRVMNLSSRQIITGEVINKNTVRVF
jgi:flagella basal body P-ring formation protein FlgA